MAELTDQDRAELREMSEQKWVDTCKTRDWEACMALCTEGLVYMPPDHTVLHGKAETQAWLSQFPELKNFTQELVDITGDTRLAVVRGTAKVTILVDGQELQGFGKFMGTATKQSGDWLSSAVCFNWDAPLS